MARNRLNFFDICVVMFLALICVKTLGQNGESNNTRENLRRVSKTAEVFRPSIVIREKIQQYCNNTGVLTKTYYPTIYVSPLLNRGSTADNGNDDGGADPGIHWNVYELVRHGNPNFRAKPYKVVTEDGYILTLFRIINRGCKKTRGPPTFLQHGLLGSAADWLLLDPEYSFPFLLAETGHDVWLGNSRGNEYSREHLFMKPEEPKYWNFSFHEMGVYDLPAAFDFILEETGYAELNYIGYELGTTMFYVCLSQLPKKYNPLIHTMIGFGPTAFMTRSQSPVQYLKSMANFYFKDGPLVPSTISSFLRLVEPKMCDVYKHGQSLCSNTLALLFGADESHAIGKKMIPRIFGHRPSTTSIKTFVHFLQLLSEDQFRQFDYGPVKNFFFYSQTVPPKYNLFLIRARTLNFYGGQDLLLDRKDVQKTVSNLGTENFKFNVELVELDHTALIYSEYYLAYNGDEVIKYMFGDDTQLKSNCQIEGTENQRAACQCQNPCNLKKTPGGNQTLAQSASRTFF